MRIEYSPKDEQIAVLRTALTELHRVADELCTAIDNSELDIGGSRPMNDILAELGPAVDVAKQALVTVSAQPPDMPAWIKTLDGVAARILEPTAAFSEPIKNLAAGYRGLVKRYATAAPAQQGGGDVAQSAMLRGTIYDATWNAVLSNDKLAPLRRKLAIADLRVLIDTIFGAINGAVNPQNSAPAAQRGERNGGGE